MRNYHQLHHRGAYWIQSTLLVLSMTCVAYADDEVKPVAAEKPVPAAGHVTQSLRVPARSVAVRANPAAQSTPATPTKQYVFLDANGNFTSTPPAGFQFPADTARGADPVPVRSTVDPNAMGIDTSHIRAMMTARIDANGRVVVECAENTAPAAASKTTPEQQAPKAGPVKSTNAASKEDGQ